jgi:uncharacterized membrane protein
MAMEQRPKPKIELTSADLVIEVAGWLMVALLWVATFWDYSGLPDQIPVHFGASGKADSFGNKTNLLMLPILGTVMYIGLTLLTRIPHVFNYPAKITPENALRQYTNAIRMIRVLKFIVVLVFTLIVLGTLRTVSGKSDGLGAWFLPLTILLFVIPFVFYIPGLTKNKK